jgi:hypothetical protein
MCKDFYGIDIEVGDTVTFPAGKEMMDGVVEKFNTAIIPQIFVRNKAGYKKWKHCDVVINRSKIIQSAPQLFI